MQKIKKLKLNKEIISSLQEKQMKSFLGGAALFTGPFTSAPCEAPTEGCASTPSCPQEAANRNPPATCCRKSCR